MKKLVVVFLFLCLGQPAFGQSREPLDVIKEHVDQVIGILKDPRYQDPSQKQIQRAKIWEIINHAFDFIEMSQRSVGQYWKNFSDEQKHEFTDLFARLLRNLYLSKIQKGYENEKVIYQSQEMLSDTKAIAKTKITSKDLAIPVSYAMHKSNGTWKVYDVTIEGVSLVQNYRAQFGRTLLKQPPAELIKLLKKKVEEEKA